MLDVKKSTGVYGVSVRRNIWRSKRHHTPGGIHALLVFRPWVKFEYRRDVYSTCDIIVVDLLYRNMYKRFSATIYSTKCNQIRGFTESAAYGLSDSIN